MLGLYSHPVQRPLSISLAIAATRHRLHALLHRVLSVLLRMLLGMFVCYRTDTVLMCAWKPR